jgi:hypothetical protein
VLLAVNALAPGWDQPLLWFLVGGLAGLLLFRVWLMALSSLCGTLLMTYAVLLLLDRPDRFDAAAWADRRTALLNWVCGSVAAVGWLIQYFLDWRRAVRKQPRGKSKGRGERHGERRESSHEGWSWWGWGDYRRAG